MQSKRIVSILLILLFLSVQIVGVFAHDSFTTLRFGSRGSEVVRLQQSLQDKGYYNSSVDGIFGPITERAVINFQRDYSLRIDGIAGRETQSTLYATSSNAAYSLLRFRSRGDAVVRLQRALQQKGYYNSSIDGIFGPITERAVINFQRDHGLIIDGIAGPQTKSKLYASAPSTPQTVTRGATNTRNHNASDIYWLSRIIHAESVGEPFEGQVAVGNVVLNRVRSNEFPNTIYNVIFEYYGSIPQFSPVAEGTIYNTPSEQSIRAAKAALNGSRPVGNSTYFFNPDKAEGRWIVNNKSYVTRIGGHTFYQ